MKPRRATPTPADPLTERLEAIASDLPPDQARRDLLAALKTALDEDRARARRRLEQGGSGLEAARALSAAADRVVTALWTWTTTRIAPPAGRGPERLALLAVGGYGRGVLAPFSDLDLLFLREAREADRAERAAEFMLYALWDLGLKVGWSARTVDECVDLARQDMTIQTALLEMRRLAGDPRLAARLRERFTRAVLQKSAGPAFVAAKLQERDARHARTGASRYRVEPNVKDGKGGLRDLNTLFWIARRLDPSSPDGEKALAGLLTARERRGADEAADFLWAVRHHLHFAAGRAEERLSFDFQPELARRMGFASGPEDAAVKRFMRRYFLIAKDVGALTRAFCAKLEADQQKTAAGLSRFLPGRRPRRRKLEVAGFVEEAGRLTLADPKAFERDPVNLLRLFRTADRADLDLHPDAFTAVTRALNLVTPRLRREPEATTAFLDVLARGNQPYRTLSLMNDAGLLGRFLPEFGRVVAQTQLNMYHAYTVDEHTLRAIGVIKDVERGRFEAEHPLSTSIMARIADKEALYLAMLLHDTGKGGTRGQEDDGSIAARRACERLGLSRSKAEMVAWLVRNHLALSDYAQKRDVSDPDTVAAFARLVENPERLRLLLVLTVADIRAVGPGVWNAWKGQLMRDLFEATEAALRGGQGADPATSFRKRQAAKAQVAREALVGLDPVLRAWAESMDDAYYAATPEDEQRAHARLAAAASGRGGAAAAARFDPARNAAELVLAAADRRGLFADVAAALAALGADVTAARVFTSARGQALDVFHLQDAAGEPFGARDPALLERARREVELAALGHAPPHEPRRARPTPRAAAFDIAATVTIDTASTEAATIVEVSGRDRPGLLADLARTLSDADLSIQSAHVDNYGARAVDAFYVLDENGAKPADPHRIAALKNALETVLGSTTL